MIKPLMLAACLLASQAVFADNDAADDNATLSVVVTPTRTAQSADEALTSVKVIDREAIEQSGAQSLPELLRGEAGLAFSSNGGPGQVTSAFLRGTESDHVLVLVDGVKLNSPTLGTAPIHTLPLENIERIEIVRGPNSSLYGSEAIGGVIQIFTRKGAKKFTPSFTLGGGSYQTANAALNLAGGGDNAWFNFGANTLVTEGFNVCDVSGAGGCFTTEPDNDGHRTASASARGGYRFGPNTLVDAHWQRTQSETEYDGGFQNETSTLLDVYGVNVTFAPLPVWHVSLQTGRDDDRSDNFLNGTFTGRFNTVVDTLSWQNDFVVSGDQVLTLGIDHQNDSVDSETAYTETQRFNTGVFGQYQGQYGRHHLKLGMRSDSSSQFGNQQTGNLAWGMRLNDEISLRLSAGTAFKAPTFNELYYPGFGNAALKPEESRSREIGMHRKTDMCESTLSLYQTEIHNLIAYDALFIPQNIERNTISGFEWSMQHKLGKHWQLAAELNLMDPRNRTAGANQDKLLPRRAEHTLRLGLSRDFGRFKLATEMYYEGKRYDDLANTDVLDPYTLLNLRGEWVMARNWRLQLKLDNLLDAQYQTAKYYHQPGRSVYLNLKYLPR